MKRKEICLILIIILFMSASTVVFAHPGHTGGHAPEEITTEDVSQAWESDSSSASLGGDSYESMSESADNSRENQQQSDGSQSSNSQQSTYQTRSAQASGVKESGNTPNPIEEVNGAAMNKTVNSTNKTNNTTNITPKNTGTGNWLVIGLVVVVILILAIGAYVKFR